MLLEELAEPVMEDLDLPHRAMAGVDLDRGVRRANRRPPAPGSATIAEIQDVRLENPEERPFPWVQEGRLFLGGVVGEEIEEVPAQPSQGGEKAVPHLQVELVGWRACSGRRSSHVP